MSKTTIAAIVLAAGRSSRMGRHKMLLPLGGRPLVSYSVEAASASEADPVLVVLGYQATEVAEALPSGRYTTCFNHNFASGMASSLRLGIERLSRLGAGTSPILGAAVLLGDQPLVSTNIINRLLRAASAYPDAIIAAAYDGERGTPVYFPVSLWSELLQIEGDEGGRSVIARHQDLLRLEPFDDPAAGLDVDRMEDYLQLKANWDHDDRNRR
jgi:molybdenum cofactor cytidylyltransferase